MTRFFLPLSCVAVLYFSCGVESKDSSSLLEAKSAYPQEPDPTLTPGSLCEHADSFRYSERIAYCERNVGTSTKQDIIHTYDTRLGFRIESMKRSDFKIDHYIPLCAGGSNQTSNLWPQHKSIFVHTDSIEQKVCELMSRGCLTQTEAVRLIQDVKHNLDTAPTVSQDLDKKLAKR